MAKTRVLNVPLGLPLPFFPVFLAVDVRAFTIEPFGAILEITFLAVLEIATSTGLFLGLIS